MANPTTGADVEDAPESPAAALELPNAGMVGAFPKPAKAQAVLLLDTNPPPNKADLLIAAAPAGVLTPAGGLPGVRTPARVAGVGGVWAGNVKANPLIGALAPASPAVKSNPPVAGTGVGRVGVSPPAGTSICDGGPSSSCREAGGLKRRKGG